MKKTGKIETMVVCWQCVQSSACDHHTRLGHKEISTAYIDMEHGQGSLVCNSCGRKIEFGHFMVQQWLRDSKKKLVYKRNSNKTKSLVSYNGYEILKQHHFEKQDSTGRNGAVLFMEYKDGGGLKFVTAVLYRTGNKWDTSWHQGNYFDCAEDAKENFDKRVKAKRW